MSTVARTLKNWALLEVLTDTRARRGLGIIAFASAVAFGAAVAVPLPWTQVPMSLQPLFVILAGAVLGARGGASAMALYLAVGAAGAPVFALGGGGLPWLMGPTGGYLLAMPAAAYLTGLIAGRDAGWLRMTLALSAGMLAIYVGGISQLFLLTGEDVGVLLSLGVLPFLAGDVTKILAALLLARSVRSTSLGR